MKINRTRLHPLYDQYSNDENRLTHALLHTIGSSQSLFSRFLKDIVGISSFSARETYEISTQKVSFQNGDNDAKVNALGSDQGKCLKIDKKALF